MTFIIWHAGDDFFKRGCFDERHFPNCPSCLVQYLDFFSDLFIDFCNLGNLKYLFHLFLLTFLLFSHIRHVVLFSLTTCQFFCFSFLTADPSLSGQHAATVQRDATGIDHLIFMHDAVIFNSIGLIFSSIGLKYIRVLSIIFLLLQVENWVLMRWMLS